MKRLTTDTPKDNLEAALNLFYITDHETWVRGGGPGPEYADVSLFNFIRDIVKTYFPDVELPADNDDLNFSMPEWLMDGIDSAEGVIALLYTAAWAYAELRHKLMLYEDTGLEPKEVSELISPEAVEIARLIEKMFKERSAQHMLELFESEKDGRLVVRQCKNGDSVYVVGECRVMQCFIEETYLDDQNGIEYLVSFVCDKDCEGCPFNSWRQDSTGEYSCDGEWGEASIKGVDFGKTVFLIREEAEAALKGGEENDPQ